MSMSIDRKALKAALTTLRPASTRGKTSLPICRLVKITPTLGGVTLATNNLELAIEVDLVARIDGDPSEAYGVNFTDLAKYVNDAKADTIALDLGKHSAVVRELFPLESCSDIKVPETSPTAIELLTTAGVEFMTHPAPWGGYLTVPAKNLKAVVGRVAHAASRDETRYNLNGIFVEGRRLVATDGHQLATAELEGEGLGVEGVIVPTAWFAAVTRLKPLGENVEVNHKRNEAIGARISTRHFEARIISRLIDGTFPTYRPVMPDRSQAVTSAKINRVDLIEALEKIVWAAPERSQACKIMVTPTYLILETSNGDERATESVDISGQVKPCAFGVNLGYAVAALKALSGEHVTLYLQPEESKGLVDRALEFVDDSGAQCIIMPMRL